MSGKNIVLLTGRGGSKSVKGKNVYPVLGRPLVFYAMNAAKQATLVDDVYVSTDCEDIKQVAKEMGVNVIDRPQELSQDKSELVEAINHAVKHIGEEINFLITMHCNCGVHRPGLVDEAIAKLSNEPAADSCVSGYVDHSVHPYRTKRITADGTLSTWLEMPENVSTNRQNLEPCFVLDGAVRVMRYSNCFPPDGQPPFSYLGNDILYIENTPGGDVHSLEDIVLTEYLLKKMDWEEASK
jgi:N-acylneuraminate cytidylyltransferase